MSKFLDLIQGKPNTAVEVPVLKTEKPKVEVKEETFTSNKEKK